MSWFKTLFTGGLGKVTESIGRMIDERNFSDEEKGELKLKMQMLVQNEFMAMEETARTELQAKERIIIAELTSGDSYTKRARPTIVYAGLLFIFINYVLFPIMTHYTGTLSPALELPSEFWVAWGGICATYSIGRSLEKRGSSNKAVRAATGSKKAINLLD